MSAAVAPGWKRLASALAFSLLAAPATLSACPVCDTATGREVRAGIFGGDFFPTLFAILAPFPVLLVLVVVINSFLTPRPKPGLQKT